MSRRTSTSSSAIVDSKMEIVLYDEKKYWVRYSVPALMGDKKYETGPFTIREAEIELRDVSYEGVVGEIFLKESSD